MDKSRIYNITSSYSWTHRNFAILNLPAVQEDENDSELQRAAKICFNILCRGQTVNPSSFLRKEFWDKDEIVRAESTHDAFPIISSFAGLKKIIFWPIYFIKRTIVIF